MKLVVNLQFCHFSQSMSNFFGDFENLESDQITKERLYLHYLSSNTAPVVPSSKFNCPITTPNHQYNGRGYAVTFFDKSDGCNKFQAEEAVEFCKSIGGQVVSLDSNEKALAMMDLLRQRAQRYMWTGGRIDHNAGVVTWPSGAREGYVRGQRFWSPTGG